MFKALSQRGVDRQALRYFVWEEDTSHQGSSHVKVCLWLVNVEYNILISQWTNHFPILLYNKWKLIYISILVYIFRCKEARTDSTMCCVQHSIRSTYSTRKVSSAKEGKSLWVCAMRPCTLRWWVFREIPHCEILPSCWSKRPIRSPWACWSGKRRECWRPQQRRSVIYSYTLLSGCIYILLMFY